MLDEEEETDEEEVEETRVEEVEEAGEEEVEETREEEVTAPAGKVGAEGTDETMGLSVTSFDVESLAFKYEAPPPRA